MSQLYTELPYIQVRETGLLYYTQLNPQPLRKNQFKVAGQATYTGTVTSGVQKRMKKAVDILLQKSPTIQQFNPHTKSFHSFRVNFITLTISDTRNIDSRMSYDYLLAPWLRTMKRKFGVRDYLWKCELQQRGQIHYHVLTNTFIDWRDIRQCWNKLQWKHGLLDSYMRKYMKWDANSIDVHKLHTIRNVSSYVGKYISKNSQNDKAILSKVWDCSESVKMDRFAGFADSATWDAIKAGIEEGKIVEFKGDRFTFYATPKPLQYLSPNLQQEYSNHFS